jgi:hypothetical protein
MLEPVVEGAVTLLGVAGPLRLADRSVGLGTFRSLVRPRTPLPVPISLDPF